VKLVDEFQFFVATMCLATRACSGMSKDDAIASINLIDINANTSVISKLCNDLLVTFTA
jgi:hypothetical protein